MNRLVKALSAFAAFATFAVLPGSASASNNPQLLAPTAELVPTGSNIIATNEGPTLLKDASGETVVSCSTAEMTGTLVTNSHAGGIAANITGASFKGNPDPVTTHTGHCFGANGATTPTPTVSAAAPWCLRSDSTMATDRFTLRGGACDKAAAAIQFTWDVTSAFGTIQCGFQRTSAEPISGTYQTHPEGATLSIASVVIKRYHGSFLCNEQFFVTMSVLLYREIAGGRHIGYITDVT